MSSSCPIYKILHKLVSRDFNKHEVWEGGEYTGRGWPDQYEEHVGSHRLRPGVLGEGAPRRWDCATVFENVNNEIMLYFERDQRRLVQNHVRRLLD